MAGLASRLPAERLGRAKPAPLPRLPAREPGSRRSAQAEELIQPPVELRPIGLLHRTVADAGKPLADLLAQSGAPLRRIEISSQDAAAPDHLGQRQRRIQ